MDELLIWTPTRRNYSGRDVLVIEEGAVIRDTNFCQRAPDTVALVAPEGTKFIDCNLINVFIPESGWILEGCNNAQVVIEEEAE